MDSSTIWRHIDTQRTALADVLETLPDGAWRTRRCAPSGRSATWQRTSRSPMPASATCSVRP